MTVESPPAPTTVTGTCRLCPAWTTTPLIRRMVASEYGCTPSQASVLSHSTRSTEIAPSVPTSWTLLKNVRLWVFSAQSLVSVRA
ncbi:hypothetical protein GCM10027586_13980 [Kineococcus gypseus]